MFPRVFGYQWTHEKVLDYFVKWTKKFVEKFIIEIIGKKKVSHYWNLFLLFMDLNLLELWSVFLIFELSEWRGILTMHTFKEESASGMLTPGLLCDSCEQQVSAKGFRCWFMPVFLRPCGIKSAFLPGANSSPVKENCNQRSQTRLDTDRWPKIRLIVCRRKLPLCSHVHGGKFKLKVSMFPVQSNEFFRPAALISLLREEMS